MHTVKTVKKEPVFQAVHQDSATRVLHTAPSEPVAWTIRRASVTHILMMPEVVIAYARMEVTALHKRILRVLILPTHPADA